MYVAATGIRLFGLLAVTGGLLGAGEVDEEEEEEEEVVDEREDEEEREEQLEVSIRGGSFPPLPCERILQSHCSNIFREQTKHQSNTLHTLQ